MDDKRELFVQVLDVARQKIKELDRAISKLEKLKGQRENWNNFIQLGQAILDGDVPLGIDDLQLMFPGLHETERGGRIPQPEETLWRIIEIVLELAKHPMTAAEILDEVMKTDQAAVRGDNKRETIRSTMIRKPDVFERVERGLFALRAWPDWVKQQAKTRGAAEAPPEQNIN